MTPWCKYSQKTRDVLCKKCKLDNTLKWGYYPCYCIFYKPALVENLKFKINLLIDDVSDIVNSIIALEE
jgi:hypothetical protein